MHACKLFSTCCSWQGCMGMAGSLMALLRRCSAGWCTNAMLANGSLLDPQTVGTVGAPVTCCRWPVCAYAACTALRAQQQWRRP